MRNHYRAIRNYAVAVAGALLLPILWIALKFGLAIPDRYLPSPGAVLIALRDLDPSFLHHCLVTASRLLVGVVSGIVVGVTIGIAFARWSGASRLLLPSIQAMRAIPPAATVPFFLLWFGFSETGKYLLITFGIGFNIAVATLQSIRVAPERYQILFKSFGIQPGHLPLTYNLPVALESLGPTVRFSVATALGLVVVSELLGSQAGLGYLIQTSRSTFAMHTIFLATFGLAALAAIADWLTQWIWRRLTFWKQAEALAPIE